MSETIALHCTWTSNKSFRLQECKYLGYLLLKNPAQNTREFCNYLALINTRK
jgi:hypothetical protein